MPITAISSLSNDEPETILRGRHESNKRTTATLAPTVRIGQGTFGAKMTGVISEGARWPVAFRETAAHGEGGVVSGLPAANPAVC